MTETAAVLGGLKVAQIGPGLAAAVCGRLFADMGAAVDCLAARTDTPLARHLNAGKPQAGDTPDAAALAALASHDLIVCEGGPRALKAQGLNPTALRAAAPKAVLVLLSPYGQTGTDADKPATDLTLFCASGIARVLTGQVDDLSEAPIRPVGAQSAFIGGLAAACAGMHAVLLEGPATVDVSIQEALATLSMTELTKAGLGGGGWSRRRLSDGNGATVCILPARDGYAAISPREDHQWTAWLAAMGSPDWGTEARFATKPDRVANWDALHALMSDWSRRHTKQAIADLAQAAHVPSFPLCEPGEHLTDPQLAHRNSFQTRTDYDIAVRTIANPFALETPAESPPLALPQTGALPLSGVHVLDFSWVIAGPTATRYLAAMGAEVIKVEAPGRGDPGRASELHTALGQAKQSIILNLKQNEAREIARRLARNSDILIENFATGVMDRLGLGAAQLQAENPDLVYISASGMGRTGPGAKAVAYGTLLQCFTGFAGLNRHPETPPRVGMAWLDPMCGLKLAFIAAAALRHRSRHGGGARVDFSMIEAMLWTMAKPLIAAQTGAPPQPRGNASDAYAPHGVYRCRGEDDWLGVAVTDDEAWRALCGLVEALGPLRDLTLSARREFGDAIDRHLAAWCAPQAAAEAGDRLTAAGIAAAPVATTLDLAQSPHLAARGFWEAHDRGALPGLPWQASFGRAVGEAPAHGAETHAVLRAVLGLSDAEIAALRAGGALG